MQTLDVFSRYQAAADSAGVMGTMGLCGSSKHTALITVEHLLLGKMGLGKLIGTADHTIPPR